VLSSFQTLLGILVVQSVGDRNDDQFDLFILYDILQIVDNLQIFQSRERSSFGFPAVLVRTLQDRVEVEELRIGCDEGVVEGLQG
jgi:hypothetical protein